MQTYSRSTWTVAVIVLLSLLTLSAMAWRVEQTAPTIAPRTTPTPTAESKEFDANIKRYLDLRKKAASGVPSIPKDVADPAIVTKHQQQLATAIRVERPKAKPGEIFTPAVGRMIIGTLKATLAGKSGEAARKSVLTDGNPKAEASVPVNLTVNAVYPTGAPLSTVPPSVLMALPTLPKELEFRFVGRTLILRDTEANIVVDILPNAV